MHNAQCTMHNAQCRNNKSNSDRELFLPDFISAFCIPKNYYIFQSLSKLERVHTIRNAQILYGFCDRRGLFVGILAVFQENLTKYGAKYVKR